MRPILVYLVVVLSCISSFAVGQLAERADSSCASKYCQYPPHSVPICQLGKPCAFKCVDGFSLSPVHSACVCPKPYTVCNGRCGYFSGCPSSGYYKRAVTGNKRLQCNKGMTACPIIGRENSWECVDTMNDLESCGGCMVSSGFTQHPDGVDCTAIQGISDVSCFHGQCLVRRCMPGYEPNALKDSCIETPPEVLLTQDGGV